MRRLAFIALAISSLILSPFLYNLARPHLHKFRPRWDLSWYDLGFYGAYPTQSYYSFDLVSPSVSILKWDDRCNEDFTFITPRGDSIAAPGPMILDAKGELVWLEPKWGQATDLMVQRYEGEDCLTFWAGTEGDGHGKGSYYMLNSSYEVVHKISPIGDGWEGDLHEFKITENGTALVTIYDLLPMDLSSLHGPATGWIYDCIFQEIDIATGNLIFQWRASEHYQVNETFAPLEYQGRTKDDPFDFFHINSIDKDPDGNYYVSARHLQSVTCISPTGEIRWVLGGHRNNFTDPTSSGATKFIWQHDARWYENNTITLFDNGAGTYPNWAPHVDYSRGLAIQLDLEQMTAQLVNSYSKPDQFRSPSQGSVQLLPETGNVFVGWGHCAGYTEFSSDGNLLCDVHFGASALFGFGRVTSYRSFKGRWQGRPVSPPQIKVSGDSAYVSWNGATEVAVWELQSANVIPAVEGDFLVVDGVEKEGFETYFSIPDDAGNYLRIVALDRLGMVLGVTDIIDGKSGLSATSPEEAEAGSGRWSLWIFAAACILTTGGILVRLYWASISRKMRLRHRIEYFRLTNKDDTES